jgi:hypothetical protein
MSSPFTALIHYYHYFEKNYSLLGYDTLNSKHQSFSRTCTSIFEVELPAIFPNLKMQAIYYPPPKLVPPRLHSVTCQTVFTAEISYKITKLVSTP